ncbi:glyoxalase [Deinococcus aetherius]|uniref:Bleomycin resistance protein n=1 Tax=Deinococcus aetherius TaxID=200252 RepID=A0ABM8AD24_9DEIO|nr:VOC family protein [Deinococcus aetherius]BDP41527.1 glyoxalase [Deinococcus aetherius]
MPAPRIVPELYSSDFAASLDFYTRVLGFRVVYARPEDRFAYLDLGGAELMLEQTTDPARTFIAGELEHPFGRGLHLQVEVEDVESMYGRVLEAGSRVLLPLEDRWYRQGDREAGNRQFVVLDPDGYVLRPFESLGTRPARNSRK